MILPNTLIANILADITEAELWWADIATKHGVTHEVVRTIGWATQPYGVKLCSECSGSGAKDGAKCECCGGEGVAP